MTIMATGILFLIMSMAFILFAAVRKGEAYEYAWAMFFGEWGVLLIAGETIPPGRVQIATMLLIVLGMASSAVLWWRLFRKSQQRNGGTGG